MTKSTLRRKDDHSADQVLQQKSGKSMSPPEFELKSGDKPTRTVTEVPEKTGDKQEGKLAVKGAGDKHAMDKNDINQGSIGDCFFLASLGAVAHSQPELLKKNITDNGDGTYTVKLYTRKKDDIGEVDADLQTWRFTKLIPREVTVDASFPTSVNGTDSANSSNLSLIPPHAMGGDVDKEGNAEQWVRIVEKAYAALCGGYDKIGNGGFTESAFEALTGEQYSEKVFSPTKRFKKKVISKVSKGEPMAMSTKSQSDIDGQDAKIAEFAAQNDIVGGHAYTVIEANEEGIKLRNPWGQNAMNAEPTLTWEVFFACFNQTGMKV